MLAVVDCEGDLLVALVFLETEEGQESLEEVLVLRVKIDKLLGLQGKLRADKHLPF